MAASLTIDWHIDIAPVKSGLWLVLAAVWIFAGVILGLWFIGVGHLGVFAWALILPFPVIISWYVLQSIFADNGRLRLEPDGFWRSLPGRDREFIRWDRVVAFHPGVFGDPLVTRTGVAVAEFEYHETNGALKTDRLANNLPYSGERLAQLMEHARQQAALGWPERPVSLAGLAESALDPEP